MVDVVRMDKTNTGLGATETPQTIVANMPCSIKWLQGKEKILFDKETHFMDGVLKCRKPTGATIKTTDKILYNTEYYEIVDLIDVNNLGVLLTITIKKVT